MAPEDSDEKLIQRYLSGDIESFGRIYDRHSPAVFGYLRGMMGPDLAEDMLQEAFIKAARNLGNYTARGRLRQWIMSIARNLFLDHCRAATRRRTRQMADGEEESIPDSAEAPDAQEERREAAGRIEEALDRLPEVQRSVFMMREEAQMTFKEIAKTLDIPLNTALSHMHRAVTALRLDLGDLNDGTR